MVEVEAVHLGAHDVVVHLRGRRPAGRVEGGEAALVGGELAVLRGHRARRVVGHAVHELRLLERAPRGEERDQVVVALRRRRGGRTRRRRGRLLSGGV